LRDNLLCTRQALAALGLNLARGAGLELVELLPQRPNDRFKQLLEHGRVGDAVLIWH
jgi:hypothetical protein